jgi:predicted RecB family nuclease
MFTLDPYAARSCPLKTLHGFRRTAERSPSAGGSSTLPGSTEFTAEVMAAIAGGRATVADLRPLTDSPAETQEAACREAMEQGAAVIIAGLLPKDPLGHRRGRAELLIRLSDGGYVPGIVKFQRALDARKDDRAFTYSLIADLPTQVTSTGWRYRWHWRWANTVQLAHLWELLAPTGFQSAAASAVVIGIERLVPEGLVATWLDLTEPNLSPAPGISDQATPVSALERYHQEFATRVEIAQIAQRNDGSEAALLPPIVTPECSYCDWWQTCRPLIDDDDVSLRINKSPLDRQEIAGLRSAGISTVSDLAVADLQALLDDYLPRVAHRQGAEDRLRLAQRRSRLLVDGLQLDRLSTGPIDLPTSSIEIDIDVETSRTDRVYLWGFWITDATGSRYQHFSSFTDLDDAGELALAVQAMGWLREMVADTPAKVFHYSDYEITRLARLAASGAPELTWALGYAAEHFVDLFGVVRRHYFGANGLGLKAVASAGAGFHWRDDDPGGLNSMIWFDEAVHAEDDQTRRLARERVLCYNEDDVRATAQLRSWLRQQR